MGRQCCPGWSREAYFTTGEPEERWVKVGWSDGLAAKKRELHMSQEQSDGNKALL